MAIEDRNRFLLSFSFFILLLAPSYSKTLRKLLQGQTLKDGDELVSPLGTFRLGFFGPFESTKRYLGIWYFMPNETTEFYYHLADGYYQNYKPVWVANRNTPILNKSGKLILDSNGGNFKILYDGGDPIAISSVQEGSRTSATLLQSGNLVLHETNSKRMLWQSFDYPTDTLLPGMKLGINFQTGHEWFLQSWVAIDSPAPGPFTLRMDFNVTERLISCRQGREVYWTSGHWLNDQHYFNISAASWALNLNYNYNFSYTSNEQESYFVYSVRRDAFPILRIDPDGELTRGEALFISSTKQERCWKEKQLPAICRNRLFDDYNRLARQVFMSGKVLKFSQSDNMNLTHCQSTNNFSSLAFPPNSFETGNNGGEKKMMNSLPWIIIGVGGALLFILFTSLSYLIIRRKYRANEEKWWMSLIIAIGVASVIPILWYLSYLILRKIKAKVQATVNRRKLLTELASTIRRSRFRRRKRRKKKSMNQEFNIFDFQTIEAATNNFSTENKIGEGGFGPVYKGKLEDGQEVAIKRLSKRSRQGVREFRNEVKLIAKLQHTNLVKLLGCSLHREERILVYEYMPNKSLDFFIFDSERKKLLNWKKRLSIIEGIAQALLYLQKFSRLKVIHRDLKANNILLDDQMNPKISDFGMAKIFGVNESELNTTRIVGTFGYMSPEYVTSGIFSIKSDVFSFGVLVLEILSSKKNTENYDSERTLNLIGYAWRLWNEDKALELIDPELDGRSSSSGELLRCIHVGLLCVQDQATDRPTMSDVISMLPNESRLLPAPKQPAFFIRVPENESINCSITINEVTISTVEAR